jgi:hypothetical protein
MQEKEEASFESSVLAFSIAFFAVKGLPDRQLQL